MKAKHLITALLVFAAAAGADAQSSLTIVDAHRAYYFGRYKQSLSLYEQLAATGSAEAAERAAFMLLQAEGHYGHDVSRDVDRATALLLQAARSGRPSAAFMLNMLEGSD
jgi:TPR repeat protein